MKPFPVFRPNYEKFATRGLSSQPSKAECAVRHVVTVCFPKQLPISAKMSKSVPNCRAKWQNMYPILNQNVKIYTQFQTKLSKSVPKFRPECQNLYPISDQSSPKTILFVAAHIYVVQRTTSSSHLCYQGREFC